MDPTNPKLTLQGNNLLHNLGLACAAKRLFIGVLNLISPQDHQKSKSSDPASLPNNKIVPHTLANFTYTDRTPTNFSTLLIWSLF